MVSKNLKRALKGAGAVAAAYGASKMMGGQDAKAMDPFVKKGMSLETGDGAAMERMAEAMRDKKRFQEGIDKIAAAGGVSRLNKGSKNVVTAKCKLGRNKPTKLS